MLAQNAEFVRKPTPGLPTAKRWDGCTGNWGRRRPHGSRANKQSVGCSPTTRVKLELVSHLSFSIREGHPRAPPPSARRLRAAEGVGQGTPGGLRCPGRWPHFPQQDEEERRGRRMEGYRAQRQEPASLAVPVSASSAPALPRDTWLGDRAVGSNPGSAETHPPPPPPHHCPSLACSPSGKSETPGRRPTLSCGRESGEGEEGGGGGRKGGGRTPGDARAAVQPAAGHH